MANRPRHPLRLLKIDGAREKSRSFDGTQRSWSSNSTAPGRNGSAWQVSATGNSPDQSETEGEDGYPIFWDHAGIFGPACEMRNALGYRGRKTAAEAGINVGKACGDTLAGSTCGADDASRMREPTGWRPNPALKPDGPSARGLTP